MDSESDDLGNNDNTEEWSGSDSGRDVSASECKPKSYTDTDEGAEDLPIDSQPAGILKPDSEPVACWETESEEHLSEEDVFCRGQEDATRTSSETHRPTSLSPVNLPHSLPLSPNSSPGAAPDVTPALTVHPGEGDLRGNRHSGGTQSPRVESSEEGGSSDAPPACVSFGISEEGAEPAQRWDSRSDTDLCRPNRHRARHTRLSQSERHVKETKSKCKRIAFLLTNAPNPHNKGALLFKKRRQRVKNYTFISYGTGENVDSGDQVEEEAEDLTECDFETSDSELEGEYSVYRQQCQHSRNRKSLRKMEGLPETQGKGALMFAQRRKRMDEIESEHEELRSKGLPVEGLPETEPSAPPNIIDTTETYVHSDQAIYTDDKQQVDYLETSPNAPKPLVPNRTAKPFLGFQVNAPPSAQHKMVKPIAPMKKKSDPKFKVPVPVPTNTSPHVWSPTADIIASRDERISVPAIKTGILPEAKRKGSSKQSPPEQKASLQNKGDRRSFIECEEDCFSLGAEACNFMQPKTIKLKNPPPVAPKPSINPACPPWMVSAALDDPHAPQPTAAKPQQMSNHWAQDQASAALQTPTNMSSQLHPMPTANSWSLQQSRSPVSMQARSPTYSPQPPQPSASRDKTPHSVASYPPQTEKTCRGQAGTLAGKGAEMFSKRQSRMEKFVVDAESKQVSKPRDQSPTSSLPSSWRYSSNIRAPPPIAYNPLLAPFYPPAAAKQPPSTSPKIKPKQSKQKPKPAAKHLNALDIMKHQPYQLDSSLFKYEAVPETKAPKTPSPKASPTPTKSLPRRFKHKPAPPRSPRNVSDIETTKSTALVSSPVSDAPKSTADALAVDTHLDEKLSLSPVSNHIGSKQVASNRPASTTSQHSSISSVSDSIAAFSPASLIARGVRQMAPRPKFSAKKQVFARSRSMSLPWQLSAMPSPGLRFPKSGPGPSAAPQRQASIQEKPFKPPTPWEAASRSPIGSVDEAFMFPSGPSSIVSCVKAAGHRKSLPEPPEEWKRRVSLDPAPVTRGHVQGAAAFQAPSISRTFQPEKRAFYGPPLYRPGLPRRETILPHSALCGLW